MDKNFKKKKIIITIIICLIITIGATIGIACYNYYGYIGYKKDFLDDYFDVENNKKESNQVKIENAIRFTSNGYIINPGTLKYYDIGIKGNELNEITSEKLDNGANINASFENGTLHLPNFFDLNLYVLRNTVNSDDSPSDILNYYFFISNIQYNSLSEMYPDFDPKNFFITYIDGTNEDSQKEIDDIISEVKIDGDFDIGNLPAIWSYSLTTESDDVYSSYSLEDNTSNNTLENYKFPKIYRTNVSSVTLAKESGDGTGKTEVKFGSENGVSFLICYYDSSVSISEPIIRGTFKTEFVDEKPIEPNTISQVNYFYAGYNGNFNNPHYKEFITPKIIKTCIITFVIAGIFTGILGFIWTIDVHAEKTTDTNKKKKRK